jgi:hypothetical protein
MFRCFSSDMSKFIAGVLYIAKKLRKNGIDPDFYRIFKIMYFADQKSLPTYYQTIFGNWYALPDGPVPEDLYQLIKKIKEGKEINEFTIKENIVRPKMEADMDEFSEIDLELIDESIKENGKLSYNELKKKSHGKAWENTATGYEMNILDIARESGANKHKIEHIKERILNCSPLQFSSSL